MSTGNPTRKRPQTLMAPLAGPGEILGQLLSNLLFLRKPLGEKLSGKNRADSLLEPMRALVHQITLPKSILMYYRTTATGPEARQGNDEVVLPDPMITIKEK